MALEEYFDGFCYLEESEERMWPGRYVWVRAVAGKPDQSHLPPSAAPPERSRAEQSGAEPGALLSDAGAPQEGGRN